MPIKSVPRLNVEITIEQSQILSDILPRGARKVLFHAIVDQIIEIFKQCDTETKDRIIGAMLDNSIQISIGVK